MLWSGPKVCLSSSLGSGGEPLSSLPQAVSPATEATSSARSATKRNLRAIDVFEPTIGPMSLSRSAGVLLAVFMLLPTGSALASRVLVMDRAGRVHARVDRFMAPASPDDRRAARAVTRTGSARAAAAPRTPTVLRRLLATGAIDQATHDRAL